MKKLFSILVFSILCLSASAQTFTLTVTNSPGLQFATDQGNAAITNQVLSLSTNVQSGVVTTNYCPALTPAQYLAKQFQAWIASYDQQAKQAAVAKVTPELDAAGAKLENYLLLIESDKLKVRTLLGGK